MKFSNISKKFLSLLLVYTFLAISVIAVNAETDSVEIDNVETDGAKDLNDMFFKVFKEGEEVDKNSVGLKDFIINPDHDYYVDITFLSSIAGYNNKLCYFTFDKDVQNPEELIEFKSSDIKNTDTIFDSIKNTNTGTTKKIGPFKKDEKVGFYIISPEGDFYSIRSLNENKNSHCAKYRYQVNGEYFISLGFEDKIIANSDKDYNDTIFLIKVDDYTFPDVADIDEIDPDCDLEETPEESIAPKESIISEVTPTNIPDKTTTTPVETTLNEDDSLPKTGEESSVLFTVIGVSLLIIGALSIFLIKKKKIKF